VQNAIPDAPLDAFRGRFGEVVPLANEPTLRHAVRGKEWSEAVVSLLSAPGLNRKNRNYSDAKAAKQDIEIPDTHGSILQARC
jgi:hypothetical protein